MLNFTDDVSDLLKDLGMGDIPETPDTSEDQEETVQENSSNDDDETIETQDEETEESEQEEINTPPTTDTKDTKDSSFILSSIAKTLLEEGYFTLDDNEKLEINSTEEFVDVLEKIRENALQTEQEDWSDHQREYFEALRSGVPHEQIAQHQQMQQAYSTITDDVLEDETDEAAELRKNILIAGFKARGFNDDKAAKWAKKAIDSGSDIDDAKEFRDELKVAEQNYFKSVQQQTAQQQEAARKKAEEDAKELRTFVNTVKEIIPGKQITPKLRKEILDGVTKPVYTDEKTGQSYNYLGDFIRRQGQKGIAKLVYILKTTKDLEDTETISTSKARKSVVDKLSKSLNQNQGNVGFAKDDGKDFNYEDYDNIISNALKF